ncbi:MAG: dephospho-CoA kinase [Lysobacterales bacterium]
MTGGNFTVALTGGVASGKSTVAGLFATLGADVADADAIARDVTRAGAPALAEIRNAFGDGVFRADGSLDRLRMRERVFADPAARRTLEAIVHPAVRAELARHAVRQRSGYALQVIPLFAEGGPWPWIDRVLVIDAPREVQVARLLARDGITRELAESMLDAQAAREARLAVADDVLANDGSPAALAPRVAALHARYVALADAVRR